VETERSNIRQATDAVQQKLHSLGNHLSVMQQSLKDPADPEPVDVDEYFGCALTYVENTLAALNVLSHMRRAPTPTRSS